MKKLAFVLLVLVSILASAQKKELILTLRPDEELDMDNTRIIINPAGVANYEIVTLFNGKYYLFTKTVKGKVAPVDVSPGEFVTMGKEDGKEYFKVVSTGKKYGPMEGLTPRYDEKKKVLYGYSYVKDGMNYFEDLVRTKTVGPLNKGGLWYIDDKSVVYSNTIKNEATGKEEVFLYENENKSGPYEQVIYRRAEVGDAPPLIITKENGKYFANVPHCKGVAFTSYPSPTAMKNTWMIEGATDPNPKQKMLYLPDGSKLESTDKLKYSVNALGDQMKLEHVAGNGTDAAYKVSYKGKELGTFSVQKSPREDMIRCDVFDHLFSKILEIRNTNWSLANHEENYLFSPTKGLIGPFTKAEYSQFRFFADGYATIRADSTIEMNGQKVLSKIAFVDFRNYPDWWAFQKRGDYVYPFKNGTEVAVTEIPANLRFFDTADKPIVKVRRGESFFLRLKGKDKLIGPVSQYTSQVVSADGKNWAQVRENDDLVEVNGKSLIHGFNIAYNEKFKTFHWFIMEGQKVFLYTYNVPAVK